MAGRRAGLHTRVVRYREPVRWHNNFRLAKNLPAPRLPIASRFRSNHFQFIAENRQGACLHDCVLGQLLGIVSVDLAA
jgi:hypothetical protein